MTCRCFSAEFACCEADITFFAARHDQDTRQWLLEDFDKWFSDPGDSRAYVLLGDAGIGKSVIAGALTQRARNKGHLGAAYFCRHNDGTRNNPRYLVGTIARQLCDCNSEISTLVGGEDGVKMMLTDSKLGVKELFTKLLEEPLGKCLSCQPRKLVIIDALDETEYESREDFLYVIKKALPRLPQWLLFFITSRPEDTVQSRLEKYNPCIRICAGDSDEQGFYQQHEQDIQLFLQKEINFSYISDSVEQVTKKCNGLFLYAYYIAEVLKKSNSHWVSQQTDLFPGDIDEFFEGNFKRVFDKIGADLYRKLFGCILAAPSPLPISFISYILNREKSNLDEQEAIDAVSLFVVRTPDGTVKFLHNLIPMWLTDKNKARGRLLIDKNVAVEYLRIMFIEIISTAVEETRATLPLRDEDLQRFVMHFAVRFLCHHVDQNSLTNVFNWLTSYRFLEKRIHSGRTEIYHVIEDFKLASSCLPAEETQQQNALQEISVALETDFHVLVECPHLLRSCVHNTLDDVGGIFLIPQVSAPCLEWNICDISAAKTLYQCNCFAASSDKKTFAGAKDRSLFFFDASTLEALGGPFEVSRDVIQRINCLEFSPDDKFVFFGRLDKWFSVGRGCVEDFPQFCENPCLHDWGRFSSDGQHIVVKRNHFSDLPETCQTKRCIEDLLSLWALKEIDGCQNKDWTCSFRQLPEMVAGFSNMGIETSSLLRRLGINLMSCEVNAMHGANYRSCYFCNQLKKLKELTDPSKESSLAPVRRLVIKLYRWIFRYQVWNLKTGRPLLQDVFNQCAQFNPFTYFCHVTSAFSKWGRGVGCAGVDQVMSVCNIAVVTAIDTFFRLRFDWSERTHVKLNEREMERVTARLKEWMLYGFRSPELGRSLKYIVMLEWVFKGTLKRKDWEEKKKLTEMVVRRLRKVVELELMVYLLRKEWKWSSSGLEEVWKLEEDSDDKEEWGLSEMIERRLEEIWKLVEDSDEEEEWGLSAMIERRLKEVWKFVKDCDEQEKFGLSVMMERRLEKVWKLVKDSDYVEEWVLSEMRGLRLKEFWMFVKNCGEEEKWGLRAMMVRRLLEKVCKLVACFDEEEKWGLSEMIKRRLEEVWKLVEDSDEEQEWELSKMIERRLKEVRKLLIDSDEEEKWGLSVMMERILEEVWKRVRISDEEEKWELSKMIERRLKEVWKLLIDFDEKEKWGLSVMIPRMQKHVFRKEMWELREMVRTLMIITNKSIEEFLGHKEEWKSRRLKEELSQLLDGLLPDLWQVIWKWTLQLDLELFCDSFKRDVFVNFPKGFLDLVGNDISHCLSPRKIWMVSSREIGEIHLLRTGFQEQDSCDYSSEKQEHRITQAKYLTFTYDDLYVVYLSYEDLLHALSLQTGTVLTSVSGRNCFYFTRERRVGYLFRSGTEERAIFVTSLLNPCKFFPVLPVPEGKVGEMTAAVFSSSDTLKSISSESLIRSWRLVDHIRGFSFEPIFESRSAESHSQLIKIQNCVFSTDGKLLAFQQHTQIKQCLVEEFEKSQCIVFEADFSFTDLCLTFSSDGAFLLFSIQDDLSHHSHQRIYVWDVKKKALTESFSPGPPTIDSFCLSFDNRNLILCGNYEIEIWEFSKYPHRLLERIRLERSYNKVKFSQCAVSQDRELLVCCLANEIFVHSLQVADIHSSKRVLRGHLGKIEFCTFLKRNRYLISYAVDGMVFLWDIAESKSVAFARIAKDREKILCMAVSPGENRAVCFISPSRVCVLNFCNLKCALPADFFTAPRKGGISAAGTSLLPLGQISSTTNIPASWLENMQPGGSSNPDLEEPFLLTHDDFLGSDESDDCGNYDDFD